MYRVCIRFCQYLLIIKKTNAGKAISGVYNKNFGAFFAQKKR